MTTVLYDVSLFDSARLSVTNTVDVQPYNYMVTS